MKGYINGIDFINIEPMKYWSVPAAKQNEQADIVRNAIFSGDYGGTLKVDGYYERFIKDEDGNCFLIARSRNVHNEVVDKIEWLPQINNWMNSLPNGTCFLTECYLPGVEGSKNITGVLGCLKEKAIARQKDKPLHLYVFDVMAFDGETYLKTPYVERIHKVMEIAPNYESNVIDYATYYTGAELWDALQDYLASGREGMVIMRNDAIVYQKRTPARVSIKCKQNLKQTIDCVIIGANSPSIAYEGKEPENWQFWQDINTGEKLLGDHYKQYYLGEPIQPITKAYYYGWAGSLRIGLYKDGEMVYFGDVSGITDEVKEHWKDYVGKVCEIGGMQLFQDGEHIAVRHPRLLSWRADKPASECTWDQLNQ